MLDCVVVFKIAVTSFLWSEHLTEQLVKSGKPHTQDNSSS